MNEEKSYQSVRTGTVGGDTPHEAKIAAEDALNLKLTPRT